MIIGNVGIIIRTVGHGGVLRVQRRQLPPEGSPAGQADAGEGGGQRQQQSQQGGGPGLADILPVEHGGTSRKRNPAAGPRRRTCKMNAKIFYHAKVVLSTPYHRICHLCVPFRERTQQNFAPWFLCTLPAFCHSPKSTPVSSLTCSLNIWSRLISLVDSSRE